MAARTDDASRGDTPLRSIQSGVDSSSAPSSAENSSRGESAGSTYQRSQSRSVNQMRLA
jgi:hypothetical protein